MGAEQKRANSELKQELLEAMKEMTDRLAGNIFSIQTQLNQLQKGKGAEEDTAIQFRSSDGDKYRPPVFPKTRLGLEGSQQGNTPLPKVDFPRFDGSNPRTWIIRCNGYFKMHPNISEDQKIVWASMHFEGRAATWFHSFSIEEHKIDWGQFVEILSARFEELRESQIVEDFNKLRMAETIWSMWNVLRSCGTV